MQCFVSKSVEDFPFREIYGLTEYTDSLQPCIFFGMYRNQEYDVFKRHKGEKTIFWTGQDSITFNHWRRVSKARHVTAHPKVYNFLLDKVPVVTLVKPSSFLNEVNAQKLGKKIYAYCPISMPQYHGKNIIDELRCGGYEITIGDGQWTQNEWGNGKANDAYDNICVGLCLSGYAGGGTSIIEMGLRGIPVVTNVFDLPHTIKWASLLDVVDAIEVQLSKTGDTNISLAHDVWASLDHDHAWIY